jgi:4-oxalocrotonate tautomerase
MPFARIDLIKGKPATYRRAIGDVIYKAMVEILKAPENTAFR